MFHLIRAIFDLYLKPPPAVMTLKPGLVASLMILPHPALVLPFFKWGPTGTGYTLSYVNVSTFPSCCKALVVLTFQMSSLNLKLQVAAYNHDAIKAPKILTEMLGQRRPRDSASSGRFLKTVWIIGCQAN